MKAVRRPPITCFRGTTSQEGFLCTVWIREDDGESSRLFITDGKQHHEPSLDPIVSEFETQERANSYDRWFRAKVQEAMQSNQPLVNPLSSRSSRITSG